MRKQDAVYTFDQLYTNYMQLDKELLPLPEFSVA
jgi:hypothetical protein